MPSLTDLLTSIKSCNACSLMAANERAGIRYVPILPKPGARVIFVGRDPSPRTATQVGLRGGNSVFINEIFRIADAADVPEDAIYITDLCKCHWRTSVGTPLPGTEERSTKLDPEIAKTCLNTWLVREIGIVQPQLVIAFGEELYALLRPFITHPSPPPAKLSAKADKSILDAEAWFVDNGPFSLNLAGQSITAAFLRHAGNSGRLPLSNDRDKRRQYYEASRERVIQILQASSR